jgi:Putative MetA-pathway of phenol degradation
MRSRRTASVLAVALLHAGTAYAVPPLVMGDVPTADPGDVELYMGIGYEKNGTAGWQTPFTEVVLGVSSWQEITVEVPFLLQGGQHGFGDAVLGTKVLLLRETGERPGLAGSFEWKLTTGSQSKGLGTGAMEYDLRLRSQKTWSWFTLLANVGYTFVNEPRENGTALERRNVGFLALGQEYELLAGFGLLSEFYWKSADVPGEPARVAADVGFKYGLAHHLSVHAAVGTSLRPASLGGPQLRSYAGLKWDFTAY